MYPNQPIRVRVSVCPCPSVKVSVWKRKTMPQNNWLRFWSLFGRFLRPVRRLGWFFFGFCVRFWSSFTCAVTDMMRKLPGKIDKRQNLALLACKWAADPTANQRQEWQAYHSNVHLSFLSDIQPREFRIMIIIGVIFWPQRQVLVQEIMNGIVTVHYGVRCRLGGDHAWIRRAFKRLFPNEFDIILNDSNGWRVVWNFPYHALVKKMGKMHWFTAFLPVQTVKREREREKQDVG